MVSEASASSRGLVAARISGDVSDVQPPASTPRPVSARPAVVAVPENATFDAWRSATRRGAAWTGTRSSWSSVVEVSTTRPERVVTYSRGSPACRSSCVGSISRSSVAGSTDRVSVSVDARPAGTVTCDGETVMLAPPAVDDAANAVSYVRADEPKLRTVTVAFFVTTWFATSTTPNATEVSSSSCEAYAMTSVSTAASASTRPEPTRSGP